MANLSNINNKFIVTDGGNGRVLIGATNDIGATLFANHPSTTAPSLTFNAPAGQVFENEDLQIAFGLNNASPYNGYMQTRFVSAPYYRNLSINPLGGNVGIGTNSPSAKLHIYGGASGATVSGNSNLLAIETNGNNGIQFLNPAANNANINFGDPNNNENGFIQYQHSGDAMRFRAGGTTILNLVNGSVGIGTATPQKKVHIEGTGGASEMQILVSSASDTVGHTAGIGLRGEGGEADGDFRIKGGIFFERIAGSFGNGKMILAVNSSVSNTSVTVADHALTIDTNKNVGIGTDSPNTKLEVRGGSGGGEIAHATFTTTANRGLKISTTSLPFGQNSGTVIFNAQDTEGYSQQWFQIGGATKMVIDNSGNVGIGTDSPGAKLHVNGFTAGQGVRIQYGNSSGTIEAVNFKANGGNNGVIGMQMVSAGVGDLWLGGSGGRSLTLYRDGNVGIGTDSPDFALDIEVVDAGVQLQIGRTNTNVGSAWMGASGSGFAVGVGAYGAGNSVTDPNGFLIDASGNLSTRRRIQAKTDTGVGVSVTRNLFVTWGGASFDYTFDPVALFGANKSGGTLGLRVSGWPTRLFDGIIVWRNDGGGSSVIGSGVVTIVQIATNDFSGVGVTVSLPSSSTNQIKISFTGWHTNDHGWSCYIKNDF